MLFTSPLFMFLFLPVAMCIYILIPKAHRKNALPFISCAFYAVACFKQPFALILMAVMLISTHLWGKLILNHRSRNRVTTAVLTNLSIWLALQVLYHMTDVSFIYPLGASIFIMASVSYIIDIYRLDVETPVKFVDTLSYISYFPVLVVGPIIKFKDFCRMRQNISVSMVNFSHGARLFAIGFVKRITVAAILAQTFDKIIRVIGNETNFMISIALVITIYVISVFAFSGYSDMGIGISYMLGMPIEADYKNVFAACTVTEYRNGFMYSLSLWIDDYILYYMHRNNDSLSIKSRTLSQSLVLCAIFFLWFGVKPATLPALVIILILTSLDSALNLKIVTKKSFLLRVFGRIITFTVIGLFWYSSKTESLSQLLNGLVKMFSVGQVSWNAVDIFSAISPLKILIIAIIAIIIYLPTLKISKSICQKISPRINSAAEIAYTVLVFGLFAISVIYFLPQFPQYAASAFSNVVI